MKPAPFDYAAPTSLAEALALLEDPARETTVLAGGQSLMPMLSMRLARPDLVVDIGRIPGLDGISERDGALVVGALTTKAALERSELVRRRHPLLHAATKLVAHPQIRNRGTVGGSMAHADPAAEYPAVALAADAWLVAQGPRGTRAVGAGDFFLGPLTTALGEDELLVEVGFPVMAEETGWAFVEQSRRHGDYAMAGVAVTLRLDADRLVADSRIVVFAVTSVARRMTGAEQVLLDRPAAPEQFRAAAAAVRDEIENPLSDIHASGDYRLHLAGVLTERALAEAFRRAWPERPGPKGQERES